LLLAAPGVGIGEREARGEKREREPVGRERNGRETLVAAAAPLEAYRVQLWTWARKCDEKIERGRAHLSKKWGGKRIAC
jgi:hypothetical protein